MRYLVAGYGLPAEFGINALFANGALPSTVALLTHAEDDRNRGLHALAKLRGLALCEGAASDPSTLTWVEKFSPDVLLSLHFRSVLPNGILQNVRLGGVNLHPSLLPMYRGANSVAWAIINNERTTGFTYHRMDRTLDTGAILLQEEISIEPDETAFSLFHREIVRAMGRLEEVIDLMKAGHRGRPQPSNGSYYSRTLPYGGQINPAWPLPKIERFIRAMIFPPFQPAVLQANGEAYPVSTILEYQSLADRLGIPLVS